MDIFILFILINFSLSSCFVSSLIGLGGGGGGGGGVLGSVTSPCHLTWVLVAVFIGFCMILEFHLNGS